MEAATQLNGKIHTKIGSAPHTVQYCLCTQMEPALPVKRKMKETNVKYATYPK